jgi:hypothetical protein
LWNIPATRFRTGQCVIRRIDTLRIHIAPRVRQHSFEPTRRQLLALLDVVTHHELVACQCHVIRSIRPPNLASKNVGTDQREARAQPRYRRWAVAGIAEQRWPGP